MVKRIAIKILKRNIGQNAAVLLLLLYVAGTSHLELIHSFAHRHAASLPYLDEQTKDQDLRMILKNDKSHDCGHDAHLIFSDKCQMCDLACQCDQNLVSSIAFQSPRFSQLRADTYRDRSSSHRVVISSSRAPPIL